MELALRYVTRFRYEAPVWDSHNALRACPRSDDVQQCSDYQLTVTPAAHVHSYTDRWGTRVDTFGVRPAHDELVVDARAKVRTGVRAQPGESEAGELDADYRLAHWAYLQPTTHTTWTDEMSEEAREVVAGSTGAKERVRAVSDHVHASMAYVQGATSVGVDPAHVWAEKAGVCQDYAHVTIALLRSLGVAARYVSGYFYAADPSDGTSPEGEEIVVATHAWVEAALPDGAWWAFDPTNGLAAGERHVTIGHGRDYDDVTPLRGVYYGDSAHELAVEVTMGLGSVLPVWISVSVSNPSSWVPKPPGSSVIAWDGFTNMTLLVKKYRKLISLESPAIVALASCSKGR